MSRKIKKGDIVMGSQQDMLFVFLETETIDSESLYIIFNKNGSPSHRHREEPADGSDTIIKDERFI